MKKSFLWAALVALTLVSCDKDNNDNNNNPPAATTGKLILEFEHHWDSKSATIPQTNTFTNNNGESIEFTTFRYYVSNIELTDSEGNIWKEEESYHLLSLGTNPVLEIELDKVPTANYVGMRYMIGVDSLRNVSGAQTGALDPANTMFWTWNSGYIFLKAEGVETNSQTNFAYHIGGFRNGNKTNALQEISYNFAPSQAEVKPSATPVVHQMVNLNHLFDGGTITLGVLANPNVVMPGPMAVNISRNYATMFQLDHVHN
jgi:hypothetical protein